MKRDRKTRAGHRRQADFESSYPNPGRFTLPGFVVLGARSRATRRSPPIDKARRGRYVRLTWSDEQAPPRSCHTSPLRKELFT